MYFKVISFLKHYVEWAVLTRIYGNRVPISCYGNTGARSISSKLNVYCIIGGQIKSHVKVFIVVKKKKNCEMHYRGESLLIYCNV